MIIKTLRRAVPVLFFALCPVFIESCGSKQQSAEEIAQADAMAVAQACYDRLLEADYDGFLAFRHDIDKIPAEMRSQLADAYKMYMAAEEQRHKGVKKFTATRAKMDSTVQVMQVFMMLDYGDGTQEEVVVPMIASDDGQWRMK